MLVRFVLGFFPANLLVLFSDLNLPILAVAGFLVTLLMTQFNHARIGPLSIILAGFGVGLVWASCATLFWLDQRLPAHLDGEKFVVEGTIATMPRESVGSTRIRLKIGSLKTRDKSLSLSDYLPLSGFLDLTCYRCPIEFISGEHWRLSVKLKQARGFSNVGLFDYERWLFQQRIIARGSIKKEADNVRISSFSGWLNIDQLRQNFVHYVAENASNELTGVLSAITVGVKDHITAEQWEVFRKTGTGHLVAISGLHISLVFLLFYTVFNGLWRISTRAILILPAQKAAALLALPPTIGFVILAGFSLPTQRAGVMLLVFYLAFVASRKLPVWHSYCAAIFLVIILDPFAPLSNGFWLSFIAVAAILLWIRKSQAANNKGIVLNNPPSENISSKVFALLKNWIFIQLYISVLLAPITIILFGGLSIIAPLANFLIIPWFSFLVMPLMLATLLSWLAGYDAFSTALLWAGEATLKPMIYLIQFFGQTDTYFDVDMIGLTRFLLVIGILVFLSKKQHKAIVVTMICLLLSISNQHKLHSGDFVVTVLDVGQGLSIIIETRSSFLVYDTGARYGDNFDIGKIILIPYLTKNLRGRRLSVVLSHADNDHSGGFKSLAQIFPPDALFVSDLSSAPNFSPNRCEMGKKWQTDEVSFEFLAPRAKSQGSKNNQSCVLKIQAASGSVLLTGDIETEAENALLRSTAELASNVLIVPHHGSKTSSTRSFLRRVGADIAIISRGHQNRFGHPNAQVHARLEQEHPVVLDTAIEGAISVVFSRLSIRWKTNRRQRNYRWSFPS
ncbi:MAG: competence protein ComEC [Parasphingorhabdus sp.]|jgi:competence protein ComEC